MLCNPSNRDSCGWHLGTIVEIDPPSKWGIKGVRVQFDAPVNGLTTAFATHEELRPAPVEARAERARRLSAGAPVIHRARSQP